MAEAWLLTLNPSDPAAVLAWILRQMADGKPAPAPAKTKASLREQPAEHRAYLMPRTPEERIVPDVAPEVGARGAAACRAAAGLSSPSQALKYASANSAS